MRTTSPSKQCFLKILCVESESSHDFFELESGHNNLPVIGLQARVNIESNDFQQFSFVVSFFEMAPNDLLNGTQQAETCA